VLCEGAVHCGTAGSVTRCRCRGRGVRQSQPGRR
jgi:hypothetical protein